MITPYASFWLTLTNAVAMSLLVFGPMLLAVQAPVSYWKVGLYLTWAVAVVVGDAVFVILWNRAMVARRKSAGKPF